MGIYSVWRRHALVYRRTWLVNFLPPITEPLLYLLSFGFGIGPMVGEFRVQGEPMSYLKFISPGMIAVGVCFQSFFEGAYGSYIRLRFQRTWHALLTAPLGYAEIFLADWIWSATRGSIAGIITGLLVVVLQQMSLWALIQSLPLIVLGSFLFAGVGMAVAGKVKTVDQINVPVFLFIVPMFTLCGTFFPRENLPVWLASFAAALPMSQLVDLLRMNIGLRTNWPLELAALLAWTLVAVYLAQRFIRPQVFK